MAEEAFDSLVDILFVGGPVRDRYSHESLSVPCCAAEERFAFCLNTLHDVVVEGIVISVG